MGPDLLKHRGLIIAPLSSSGTVAQQVTPKTEECIIDIQNIKRGLWSSRQKYSHIRIKCQSEPRTCFTDFKKSYVLLVKELTHSRQSVLAPKLRGLLFQSGWT